MAWAIAWASYGLIVHLAVSVPGTAILGAVLGILVGVVLSLAGQSWWRRALIGAGFPASLVLSGVTVLPTWTWLLLLVLLVLIYPLNAWRDAPVFPTPAHSLRALARVAPLPPGARILDAGCGLGDGLMALREAYPQAQLHGVERSFLLWAWCALRCPWARVRRGDMWQTPWEPYDLLYMFQRPESMPRALEKARASMRDAMWLASLDFDIPGLSPHTQLALPGKRVLWVYRLLRSPVAEEPTQSEANLKAAAREARNIDGLS